MRRSSARSGSAIVDRRRTPPDAGDRARSPLAVCEAFRRSPLEGATDQRQVMLVVSGREPEAELEPARANQLDERLEARPRLASFPAPDRRAVRSRPSRELRLGEPGAPPRLAQEIAADHP